jgi:hypothetical protein
MNILGKIVSNSDNIMNYTVTKINNLPKIKISFNYIDRSSMVMCQLVTYEDEIEIFKPLTFEYIRHWHDIYPKYTENKICQEIFNDWIPAVKDHSSEYGFDAIAFKNDDINTIIISYGGTDVTHEFEIGDIITDAMVFLGQDKQMVKQKCMQLSLAKSFYKITKKIYPNYDYYICGHSLGGWLAQNVIVKYNLSGITFNSLNFKSPQSNYDKIKNFIIYQDIIGRLGYAIDNKYIFIIDGIDKDDIELEAHYCRKYFPIMLDHDECECYFLKYSDERN